MVTGLCLPVGSPKFKNGQGLQKSAGDKNQVLQWQEGVLSFLLTTKKSSSDFHEESYVHVSETDVVGGGLCLPGGSVQV